MFRASCGAPLGAAACFCASCGTAVGPEAPGIAEQATRMAQDRGAWYTPGALLFTAVVVALASWAAYTSVASRRQHT